MNVFVEVTVLSIETRFSAHLSHGKQRKHGSDTHNNTLGVGPAVTPFFP